MSPGYYPICFCLHSCTDHSNDSLGCGWIQKYHFNRIERLQLGLVFTTQMGPYKLIFHHALVGP